MWSMGRVAASTSGPILGGLLTAVSWRLIFFVNVPVGIVALVLLTCTVRGPRHAVPFDWAGQVAAVLGMGGLTYGAIETGAAGIGSPRVLAAFAVAVVALAVYFLLQARGRPPMMPLDLFRSRTVSVPVVARLAERFGARTLITSGLVAMTAGLAVIAVMPAATPVVVLALLMILVGLAGPFVMPPIMGLLLQAVPNRRAGVASGVFNTGRQVGGALAIAVFGTFLAHRATFLHGLRVSLLIAAAVSVASAGVSLLIKSPTRGATS